MLSPERVEEVRKIIAQATMTVNDVLLLHKAAEDLLADREEMTALLKEIRDSIIETSGHFRYTMRLDAALNKVSAVLKGPFEI